MNTKTYVMVSAVIFTLVALMHLMRLMQGWLVQVGTFSVPIWISVLALLVSVLVAIWGFSLVKKV